MKLGITIGYSGAELRLPLELIQRAEEFGYDSVWTSEAYGSDAITPLAYIAAKTEQIRLATGIIQIAARTPAATAMEVQTVDAVAGGSRFIAGLGVSGPQIVEGWYGAPWEGFEFQPVVTVTVTEDVAAALGEMKPHTAFYVGGMGHRELNFHKQQMVRLGYGEAAERIQELFLAGRREEAIEAVPDDYLDETALVGPPDRIRERFQAWVESGITGLTIGAHGAGTSDTLELRADLADVRPAAVTMR